MGSFRRDDSTTQPGASSQPEGDGPVTLEDRLDGGAPDTNQGKTEPMSPTPDHPEPMAPGSLADMSPGAADPQAPRHPAATAPTAPGLGTPPAGPPGPGDGHGDTATAPATGDGPLAGSSQTQQPVDGVRPPEALES